MTAVRGAAVPGLRAIVPIVGISRRYGYAYGDGVRYFLKSEVPTDEGIDTPLAFDFGLTRPPPTDSSDPLFADKLASRANPCDAAEHTVKGYDETPDYDQSWRERDHRKDASSIRAAVLVATGWQDYNVKQEEGVELYRALPDGILKRSTCSRTRTPARARTTGSRCWTASSSAPGERPQRHRQRAAAGADRGRSATEPSTGFRSERSWPPPGAKEVRFALGQGSAGFTDLASSTEERSTRMPATQTDWFFFQAKPFGRDRRMTGSARLDLTLTLDRDHGHLTPVLVDMAPDGTTRTVSRGFLNLLYRNGLSRSQAVPAGEPIRARVTFKPQDQFSGPATA